jgi:hypothetical protein
MASHEAYPRRKRPQRGPATHSRYGSAEAGDGAPSREAIDVAAYVSDMTAQLEAMALAANHDLLAYFLGMARSEADLFLRTSEGAEDETGGAGLSEESQAGFDHPED